MKRTEDAFPVGVVVGGQYQIQRVVGSGAMGAIHEAWAYGQRFALKSLPAAVLGGDASERRARFLREAAVCETIRHPNIVPVLSHGIDADSGVPYLVMPLLEGEDMAALLDRVGTLAPEVAGALFVQACAGLSAVHARGVVHRDVKPSNLFLVHDGDQVLLKVTDFGLAKVHGDGGAGSPSGLTGPTGLTGTGRFMGTPHYVSPEQAVSAKHVDARSDVFSLAMSLYHALSGAPAFAYAKSFMKLVLEITSREAPHLGEAAPWVPPSLVRVVHGALLREPSARCPSAGELALGLKTALGIEVTEGAVTASALRPLTLEEREARRRASPAARRGGLPELPERWEDVLRA